MTVLALRSLRHRATAFAASFLALFLGAAIVMTFASMLDTSRAPGVSPAERETLVTVAAVVGGWGLVIVAFAVASTLSLTVRQRSREIALLKAVGATPAQLRRLIGGEAMVTAVVAGALAIVPASLAGAVLLDLLQDTGQVGADVGHRFGAAALCTGFGVTLAGAGVAAAVAARRAARLHAREAMAAAAAPEPPRLSRKRLVAAGACLAIGLDLAVVTATAMRGKGVDAMATGGQASIFVAIGFALLAPVLIRTVTARLTAPLERRAGASGYLCALNVRARSHQMAGTLMPIVLFCAIAIGTLAMQSIENTASDLAGAVKTTEEKSVETLNLVVVGMIAVFAAVMLVNTLVGATIYRRQEFGQQRLAGSTSAQVVGMVGLEHVALCATGVLFGMLAALCTVVPFSIARTGSAVPDAPIAIYAGTIAAAACLTLAASLGATRRALRTPAVQAAA